MILRALGAASTAISIAAGLADASGDGAAFKVWFVAKGTIVIAAVDAFALGVVPHATVFERMARGTEDADVSDHATNIIAALPGIFDWAWAGARRGFKAGVQ